VRPTKQGLKPTNRVDRTPAAFATQVLVWASGLLESMVVLGAGPGALLRFTLLDLGPQLGFSTSKLGQQAHVERYLSELDLEDAEPGVETPFQQQPAADTTAAAVVATQARRSSGERAAPRTEQASHRVRLGRLSDVTGRAGLGLAGLAEIGLRALDVQQLAVGGGVGGTRVRALEGGW